MLEPMPIGFTTDSLDIVCACCAYRNYFTHELSVMKRKNLVPRPDDVCGTCGMVLSEAYNLLPEVIAQAQHDADRFTQNVRQSHKQAQAWRSEKGQ
jgi:hypothetical protein